MQETYTAHTTRTIAFLLIGLYGVGLLVIGIKAATLTNDPNGAWLDLFKSGFLVLGGGLTTIIGYYFGSRGTEDAQRAAEAALEQLKETRDEMGTMKGEADQLRELVDNLSSMAPTLDEEALDAPDDLGHAEEI